MDNNIELVPSIGKSLNIQAIDSNLSKGHLIDAFAYSDNKDLMVEKTGKEIKEGLEKQKAHETQDLLKYKSSLESCRAILQEKGVTELPKGKISEYTLRGYASSEFPIMPLLYTYDQKESFEPSSIEKEDIPMYETESEVRKDASIREHMNKYNEYARKMIEAMVEIKLANTLQNGLKDNKNYKLSLSQAAALGF